MYYISDYYTISCRPHYHLITTLNGRCIDMGFEVPNGKLLGADNLARGYRYFNRRIVIEIYTIQTCNKRPSKLYSRVNFLCK